MSVPQVTARIFVLESLLASLAVAAVLCESVTADLLLFALGVVATAYLLYLLARGRA